MSYTPESSFKGYLAEFIRPDELVEAIKATRREGYEKYDAFSPYPLEEFADAMDAHHSKLPWIVFLGGAFGALSGWALQYWTSVHAYPMNIGGRPFNSWPSFIVIIFEMTILFAGFSAVLGMFAVNGLPRPHHPLFNVEGFSRCSQDRYFLFIETEDPRFDAEGTKAFLQKLQPSEVTAVED